MKTKNFNISRARKSYIAETKIFWNNVEYLKQINGATDADVAKATCRSKTTICNRRTRPGDTTLRDVFNIALLFNVDPGALLEPMIPKSPERIREENV